MKTLKQLIASKSKKLATVSPKDTVLHALEVMAQYDVGALIVLDGQRLAGMFSERDYARKVILPVSYTHLDVYKRQLEPGRPPPGRLVPPPTTPFPGGGPVRQTAAMARITDCLLYTSRCV